MKFLHIMVTDFQRPILQVRLRDALPEEHLVNDIDSSEIQYQFLIQQGVHQSFLFASPIKLHRFGQSTMPWMRSSDGNFPSFLLPWAILDRETKSLEVVA